MKCWLLCGVLLFFVSACGERDHGVHGDVDRIIAAGKVKGGRYVNSEIDVDVVVPPYLTDLTTVEGRGGFAQLSPEYDKEVLFEYGDIDGRVIYRGRVPRAFVGGDDGALLEAVNIFDSVYRELFTSNGFTYESRAIAVEEGSNVIYLESRLLSSGQGLDFRARTYAVLRPPYVVMYDIMAPDQLAGSLFGDVHASIVR